MYVIDMNVNFILQFFWQITYKNLIVLHVLGYAYKVADYQISLRIAIATIIYK